MVYHSFQKIIMLLLCSQLFNQSILQNSTPLNNITLNDQAYPLSINNSTNHTPALTTFSRSFFLNLFNELGDKSSLCVITLAKEVSPFTLLIAASTVEVLFTLGNSFIGYGISSYVSMVWIKLFSIIVFLLYGVSLIRKFKIGDNDKNIIPQPKEPTNTTIEENKISNTEDVQLDCSHVSERKELTCTHHVSTGEQFSITSITTIQKNPKFKCESVKSFFKVALLILMSELGDRSQVTTIVLSASHDPFLIFLGSALAHVVICVICVCLGYFLSKIPSKAFFLLGASIFVFFSVEFLCEII